jgi:hypothetical protein
VNLAVQRKDKGDAKTREETREIALFAEHAPGKEIFFKKAKKL